MSILCKRCDTDMQTVFYEGVAIQLCMSCKAVFLSKKKLEIIENSREIDIPEDFPAPRNGPEVRRECPSCKIPMNKVRYGKIRHTMIDMCGDCNGIWLDKGELTSIQLSFEIAEKNQFLNQLRRA
jgi:Zn-finger nucleic acid-binding protein